VELNFEAKSIWRRRRELSKVVKVSQDLTFQLSLCVY
jgi:hypothetical protein